MGLELGDTVMMVLRWIFTIAFVVVFVVSVVASGDRLRDRVRDRYGLRSASPSSSDESGRLQDAEYRQTDDWQQRPDRIESRSPHHS